MKSCARDCRFPGLNSRFFSFPFREIPAEPRLIPLLATSLLVPRSKGVPASEKTRPFSYRQPLSAAEPAAIRVRRRETQTVSRWYDRS